MKRILQYSLYPIFMLSAWCLMLLGVQSGLNQYLVTIPIIALFGIIALFLGKPPTNYILQIFGRSC